MNVFVQMTIIATAEKCGLKIWKVVPLALNYALPDVTKE